MKRTSFMKLVFMSTVLFLSVCVFSQTKAKFYEGKTIVPNVIRVKFTNEPAVIQKMEAAYKVSGNEMRTMQVKSTSEYIEIPGLSQLNSLNESYSAIKMTRVFRPAGKYEQRHRDFGLHLWYEIEYKDGVDVDKAISSYSNLDYVQKVNPRYQSQLTGSLPNGSDDPQFASQWHYENSGANGGTVDADIDLEQAWTIETGNSNVVVAVGDGGIDVDHVDLAGNVWVNSGEIAGNGIDDDNNGYVDDVNGYNFVTNSGTIVAVDHGTHTSGTIGAETNNGIGVAGIAGGTGSNDGVRLMSCQIFSSSSSTDANGMADAFAYSADNGAVISQNSWGYNSADAYDQAVLDGIDYFIANAGGPSAAMDGGIVIFAAGNSNSSGAFYPAYYSPTLAVASVNNRDVRASYSNYGTWVDIAAPGGETSYISDAGGVLSTISNNGYAKYQGTSMACPHVSGVAALVVSHKYGNITASELRSILVDNVDPIDNLNPSYAGQLGSGRLNAYLALSDEPILPGPASNPSPSNGATKVSVSSSLSWSAGSGAASHDVYFGTTNPPTFIGNQTSVTFDPGSLALNTEYFWRIDEVNSIGTTTGTVWSFKTDDGTGPGEYASFPYSTGFESGTVDDYWVLITENSNGNIQVTSLNEPLGSYHLTSDVSGYGTYSTNEAWLKVDLSGQDEVNLSFYWKEFGDEDDAEDGVYISDNGGSSFTKVYNLTGGSSIYQKIDIDIVAAAAANGLNLSSTFVIKFQQRDNYPITFDGMAFDDISVGVGSISPPSYPVNLVFVFDNYPEETSWQITNSSGTLVKSGGTYGSEPDGSTKTIAMQLPAECFDLTIFDAYGDGICCEYGDGSYELLQGTTVLASGGSFTSSETTNFCVVATSEASQSNAEEVSDIKDRDENFGIEIYPNPVSNYLVVKANVVGASSYLIRDVAGKTIKSDKLINTETYVDLSKISAGMYLIDVSINGENQTLKFIKR